MPAKRKRSLNAATEARAVKARAESEEAAPKCTAILRRIPNTYWPAGQAPPRDVSPQGLVRSSNLDGSILAALSLVRSLMPGASNTDFASLLVLASPAEDSLGLSTAVAQLGGEAKGPRAALALLKAVLGTLEALHVEGTRQLLDEAREALAGGAATSAKVLARLQLEARGDCKWMPAGSPRSPSRWAFVPAGGAPAEAESVAEAASRVLLRRLRERDAKLLADTMHSGDGGWKEAAAASEARWDFMWAGLCGAARPIPQSVMGNFLEELQIFGSGLGRLSAAGLAWHHLAPQSQNLALVILPILTLLEESLQQGGYLHTLFQGRFPVSADRFDAQAGKEPRSEATLQAEPPAALQLQPASSSSSEDGRAADFEGAAAPSQLPEELSTCIDFKDDGVQTALAAAFRRLWPLLAKAALEVEVAVAAAETHKAMVLAYEAPPPGTLRDWDSVNPSSLLNPSSMELALETPLLLAGGGALSTLSGASSIQAYVKGLTPENMQSAGVAIMSAVLAAYRRFSAAPFARRKTASAVLFGHFPIVDLLRATNPGSVLMIPLVPPRFDTTRLPTASFQAKVAAMGAVCPPIAECMSLMRLDAFMSLKLLVYEAATGGNAHRDPHARAVLLRLVFGLAGSERSLGFYQLNAEGSFEPPKEALVAQLQQAAGGVGLALLPEAYSGDCVACHRGMPGDKSCGPALKAVVTVYVKEGCTKPSVTRLIDANIFAAAHAALEAAQRQRG